MSTNNKKTKSSEETLDMLRAFIDKKGGIVKKEEFLKTGLIIDGLVGKYIVMDTNLKILVESKFLNPQEVHFQILKFKKIIVMV